MWNEHCSYKSSRLHLKHAADQGALGDPGPGRERRRHRHRRRRWPASSRWRATTTPPTSSPTRARRPASAASCATSSPWARGRSPPQRAALRRSRPSARRAISSPASVAGIGGYGNSFGVPTVGGEINFHTRYDGNILVNAMAVGIAKADEIFYAKAAGVGHCRSSISAPRPAATASTARPWPRPSSTTGSEEKRPTVQVGDPFAEKLLLEACLELMADRRRHRHPGHGRGGPHLLGGRDGRQGRPRRRARPRRGALPRGRHDRLRDDAVGEPGAHAHGARARQGGRRPRRSSASGASTSRSSATPPTRCASCVKHQGEVVADLPIKELGDEAPLYDRPWIEPTPPAGARRPRAVAGADGQRRRAAASCVGSPDLCSKRWVWEQYDHLILGNTVQQPGRRRRRRARRGTGRRAWR